MNKYSFLLTLNSVNSKTLHLEAFSTSLPGIKLHDSNNLPTPPKRPEHAVPLVLYTNTYSE